MPLVTASDFKLMNSNPGFVAQVNQALLYAQTQDSRMTEVLADAAKTGIAIMNNPVDNMNIPAQDRGETLFGQLSDGNKVALWNPESALLAKDGGLVTGVQSPAQGLIHELVGHGMDPNQEQNRNIPDAQYDNASERVAVTIESVFAEWMGEPGRDNHGGQIVWVPNPTMHTVTTEDGALQLVQMGANGQLEYGPQIAFGTPEWNEIQSFGQEASSYDGPGPYAGGAYVDDNSGGAYGGSDGGYTDGGPDGSGSGSVDVPGNGDDPYNGEYDDPNHGGSSDPGPGGGAGDGDYGCGGGGGCVAISSFLPDGRSAGEIAVGDTMQLGDADTMEAATGVVGYSEMKEARGYRITTVSGASLVCSDTAPIPARNKGLLIPEKLMGEHVAVRWDEHGQTVAAWEAVTKVEEIGTIKVQHITVGNKCFWAGEKKGAYILHHNLKDAGGGGGGFDWPWDFFDLTADVPPLTDGFLLS